MKFQIIALIILICLIYFHQKEKLKTTYFFTFLFVFIIAQRWGDFFVSSIQSDEDQWIICARSIVDQWSEWCSRFILFDFNRLLTILPLALFYFLTGHLDYGYARLIFLFFFFLFLCIQYRLLKTIFTQMASMMSIVVLAITFSFSNHLDFIVYNSEMPVIVLVSIFLLGFNQIVSGQLVKSRSFFFLAVLTAMIPFAKEQALYLSLFSFSFIIFFLCNHGRLKEAFVFFSGGLIFSFFVMCSLLFAFGLEQLTWFFGLIIEYSKSGLRSNVVELNADFVRFSHLVVSHFELVFISVPGLLGILLLLRWVGINAKQKWLAVYYFLAFSVTMYSIYTPHNYFLHYCILLFPFYLFLTSLFFEYLFEKGYRYFWVSLVLIGIAVPSVRYTFGHERKSDAFCKPSEVELRWEDEIAFQYLSRELKCGDDLFVWGWATYYYNVFRTKRISGFLYPQFNMGYFTGKAHTNKITIEDLTLYKPKFIVELVGESRPYFKDKETQGILKVNNELRDFINRNYVITLDTMDSRIYQLRG